MITIIAFAINYYGKITDRFNKLDRQIESISMLLFVISRTITTLKVIDEKARGEIINALASFNRTFEGSFERAYEGIAINKNPLSQAELDRLKMHLERMKRAELFTPNEAQDFYNIAEKIKNDKPSDSSSLLLAALAGFVLGLIVSSE